MKELLSVWTLNKDKTITISGSVFFFKVHRSTTYYINIGTFHMFFIFLILTSTRLKVEVRIAV